MTETVAVKIGELSPGELGIRVDCGGLRFLTRGSLEFARLCGNAELAKLAARACPAAYQEVAEAAVFRQLESGRPYTQGPRT